MGREASAGSLVAVLLPVVGQAIELHEWVPVIGGCTGCDWRGFRFQHSAHVAEEVSLQLVEELELEEDSRQGFMVGFDEHAWWKPGKVRLVSKWQEVSS